MISLSFKNKTSLAIFLLFSIMASKLFKSSIKIGMNAIYAKEGLCSFHLDESANVTFNNSYSQFLSDSFVYVYKNASLIFNGNFILNYGSMLRCEKSISFGNDVMVGNYSIVSDSDGHPHSVMGNPVEFRKPIIIGNHVWVGSGVYIMKGIKIGNNVTIGAKTIVTKDIPNNVTVFNRAELKVIEDTNWKYSLLTK